MPRLTVARAAQRKRESRAVEFKSSFDPSDNGEWCELIKDIVAIANSGGGAIVFGAGKGGAPSGFDPTRLLEVDPAVITDKIARYTGVQFDLHDLSEVPRNGDRLAVLDIGPARVPLVFQRPGTYDIGDGKQTTAFAQGTVYFRHGAKSEPATSDDLRSWADLELSRIRNEWMANIAKVVEAEPGAVVNVTAGSPIPSDDPTSFAFRTTDDPNAPEFHLSSPDDTHPFRQKEVVLELNRRLGAEIVNRYDIQCVRAVFAVDEGKPDLVYTHKFGGSPQYSEAFVTWLVTSYQAEPNFFRQARARYRLLQRSKK